MSQRKRIKELLQEEATNFETNVKGWVRTFRNQQFITLNDGSTYRNLQVVIDPTSTDPALMKRITTGAALSVTGSIVASLGKGQKVEMKAHKVEILGDCDPSTYPLQPKKHSLEFLREHAHLRLRTNTFGSILRIRNSLAYAIHQFFQERNFIYLHTPIITASDAEGLGELFRVSTLDLQNPPKTKDNAINFQEDFFGKATYLTVSGQLEGELGAMAFSDIYTFGPTFRAENSNTSRHLAEFWMVEPEMAFYDLTDTICLAESLLKYLIQQVLERNSEDLAFLNQRFLDEEKQKPPIERSAMDLLEKLQFCLNNDFQRLTYTEAIAILKDSMPNRKKKFTYLFNDWGMDLQSEHERYLVEKHFKKPVIVTDYPKAIKAFYMRQNDDEHTVAAMDILFPGIGEIIGGAQREERYEQLEARMEAMHIPTAEMWWYLDTRRFGTCPHAGFGLGFERLVLFVTGMSNIRDVIPFPRTPKNVGF